MDFLSILLIAIGLSADCFAVALGGSISMKTLSRLQIFRVSLAFGLFQALMPVLGWLAGQTLVKIIADYDHWAAFILLAIVGGRMIWESFRSEETRSENADITKGFLLLTLSVATSIDALVVGLSFAFLEISIITASLTIGIVALVVTAIGFLLGRKLGSLIGRRAEALGGVVLIGIGLRILLTHIL
ncbi:MAG: manganese efflux pump [Dehalococcoidia bacterium]|nr:manganese efflux pump [Dehalococcoidia bacterium]